MKCCVTPVGLSELTGCAGIVSVPRAERLPLRQIDFVQLAPRRLLVILVFDDGQVQNRLVHTERGFLPEQLLRASEWLNERFGDIVCRHSGTSGCRDGCCWRPWMKPARRWWTPPSRP